MGLKKIIIFALFIHLSCNNSTVNDKSSESLKNTTSQSTIDKPALYLSFEEAFSNKNITLKKDIACHIKLVKNKGVARKGEGFLLTSVENTKASITTKAIIQIEGNILYDQNNWLKLSFLIPEKKKIDKVNYGKDLIIFKIQDNVDFQHILSLEYIENENNNYLGLRSGKYSKLISIKENVKGKWNDVIISINLKNNKYGYVSAWINNELFTPFNGYTNKVFGNLNFKKNTAKISVGQMRNWKDSNPSILYFDEIKLGETLESISNQRLNVFSENEIEVYK